MVVSIAQGVAKKLWIMKYKKFRIMVLLRSLKIKRVLSELQIS